MKYRKNTGFSIIELLVIIAVIAIIGGVGYVYFHNNVTTSSNSGTPNSNSLQAITAPAGTTSIITQLTAQDAQTEAGVDKSSDSQTQQNATSANSAASNVGGAYDASNF